MLFCGMYYVIMIPAGHHHGAGIVSGHTLYLWGSNSHGQLGRDAPEAVLVASHQMSQELELPQVRTCGCVSYTS